MVVQCVLKFTLQTRSAFSVSSKLFCVPGVSCLYWEKLRKERRKTEANPVEKCSGSTSELEKLLAGSWSDNVVKDLQMEVLVDTRYCTEHDGLLDEFHSCSSGKFFSMGGSRKTQLLSGVRGRGNMFYHSVVNVDKVKARREAEEIGHETDNATTLKGKCVPKQDELYTATKRPRLDTRGTSKSSEGMDSGTSHLTQTRFLSMLPKPDYRQLVMKFLKFLQNEAVSLSGCSYRWLNRVHKDWHLPSGYDLLLVFDPFLWGSKQRQEFVPRLQRLKEIQVRVPNLLVVGIQYVKSLDHVPEITWILNLILQEYITFPVLLCSENSQMGGHTFSDDLAFVIHGFNQLSTFEEMKIVEVSILAGIGGHFNIHTELDSEEDARRTGWCAYSRIEYAEEPMLSCAWKNTLLCFPGCISVDGDAHRLFISDTNHHRIIIADAVGNVLDCVGSSLGFQDGSFESARLCRPASTLFDPELNCLYIADSENHAIRKADLGKRVVETVRPEYSESKPWWIVFLQMLKRMGFKDDSTYFSSEQKSCLEKQDGTLLFPWHLCTAGKEHLHVASQSFLRGNLICKKTGIKEPQPEGWLEHHSEKLGCKSHLALLREVLHSKHYLLFVENLESRITEMDDALYIADTEHHRILKIDCKLRQLSTLKLSHLGSLGMPAWWSFPVDSVSSERLKCKQQAGERNYLCMPYDFHVRPGRCELHIIADLPKGAIFAAPVEDACIWRQARGSIVELSSFDGLLLSEKISGAQQWYDDIEYGEDLEFPSEGTEEANIQGLKALQQSQTSVHIYALIDASLGTGEVVVDAALYLKYESDSILSEKLSDSRTGYRRNNIENVDKLNLSHSDACRSSCKVRALNDCCIWSDTNEPALQQGVEDQIFMNHLHVQVRFEVSDSAPDRRTLEVNVKVNSVD